MSGKDKHVLKALEAANKIATADKDAAIRALQDAGIITKNGKFTKPYQTLCTPQKAGS